MIRSEMNQNKKKTCQANFFYVNPEVKNIIINEKKYKL